MGGSLKDSQSKIYWHDAFFEAVRLELAEYKDVLEFKNEHHLSKEALKIDVIVIKKAKDVEIKKNFGQIFRTYNVFEYKSETDSLSISDYDKVNGYARLYAAFEERANMKDMSITFVVSKNPKKLFQYIKDVLKFEIIQVHKGIYYIEGAELPIQILKSNMLSEEDNLYLKSLSSNLNPKNLLDLFDSYQKQVGYNEKNAYLDRIMEANKEILKEVLKMSLSAEVKEIIMEGAERNGWLDEIMARATKKAEEKVEIIKLEVERARLAEEKAERARLEAEEKAEKARLEAEEKAVEVAKKLLKRGLNAEDISEDTGLPINRIT